jgi:NAD(P)-dependent dehydrogenase (short-subunit alcohol dehydrogenase family)
MNGKICLITGATSGIGKATAMALARMGATVVVGARDEAKAAQTIAKIRQQFPQAKAEALIGDLASLAQVRRMAGEFTQRFGQLDVLINNAGIQPMERRLTEDGLEATFQVNYLAHFLLTQLLLPLLRQSAPSRIVNVASVVHRWCTLDLGDLNNQDFETNRAYYRSKLAMVYFTYELARRLEGTGVSAIAMEPGLVDTDFARGFSGIMRLGNWLMSPFKQTSAQGADTVVWLASSHEVANLSGKYFAKRRALRSSVASYDRSIAVALWAKSL